MTHKTKKYKLLLLFVLLFIAASATWLVNASGTVKLYLYPASHTVTKNSTFTVAIRLNAVSTAVDYARAYMSFPTDKLQVVSISSAGSEFSYQHEQTYDNSAGTIKVARYSYGTTLTGDLLLSQVTFRAVNEGAASIVFTPDSTVRLISDASSEKLTSTSGGNYTVTGTPASNTPAPSLSTPSQPSPNPTPTPIDPSAPQSPPSNEPNQSTSITAPPDTITPQDEALPTVPVKIVVLSNDRKPVSNASVTINGLTQHTNENGTVHFVLAMGTTVAHVKADDVSKEFDLNIERATDNQALTLPIEQSFVFVLPPGGTLVTGLFGAALLLPLGMITVFIVNRHRKTQRHPLAVFGYAPYSHLKKPRAAKHHHSKIAEEPSVVQPTEPVSRPKKTMGHIGHKIILGSRRSQRTITPVPATSKPKDVTTLPALAIPILPRHEVPSPPPVKTIPKQTPEPKQETPILPKPVVETEATQSKDEKPKAHNVVLPAPASTPRVHPESPVDDTHRTPDWQQDIKRNLAKTQSHEKYVEPKDMFELAEEQFHYEDKFKKHLPPKQAEVTEQLEGEEAEADDPERIDSVQNSHKKYLF